MDIISIICKILLQPMSLRNNLLIIQIFYKQIIQSAQMLLIVKLETGKLLIHLAKLKNNQMLFFIEILNESIFYN